MPSNLLDWLNKKEGKNSYSCYFTRSFHLHIFSSNIFMMYPINHFRNYIKNLLNPLIFTRISDNFFKLTIQVNYFFFVCVRKKLDNSFSWYCPSSGFYSRRCCRKGLSKDLLLWINVSSFVTQETCGQDRSCFIGHTRKSLRKTGSLCCYSRRL